MSVYLSYCLTFLTKTITLGILVKLAIMAAPAQFTGREKAMLKNTLIVVAIVAFAATAQAQITIDGLIDDWSADNIFIDPAADNTGEADMLSWGILIEGGYLYGFAEMDEAISVYDSGANDIWCGLWIDVDNQGGDASSLQHTSSYLGHEWENGFFDSFDIGVEWGVNTGHWGEGFNFWGKGDDAGVVGSAIVGGATAYDSDGDGNIMEFQCPISEIVAELAEYPDNVTPGSYWRMGMRVEASIGGAGLWGSDNSDTTMIDPDPTPGDADLDGDVDEDDAAILASNWLTAGRASWVMGDFNGDFKVDGIDATIMAANWNSSTAAVPEPGTALLLAGGLALLFVIRRQ